MMVFHAFSGTLAVFLDFFFKLFGGLTDFLLFLSVSLGFLLCPGGEFGIRRLRRRSLRRIDRSFDALGLIIRPLIGSLCLSEEGFILFQQSFIGIGSRFEDRYGRQHSNDGGCIR